jgi:high affinity Mn2+ porin
MAIVCRLAGGAVVVLALTASCRAADLPIATPNETGPTGNYDWAGAYVGAELGYAAGASNWSAGGAGGSHLSGSFDMFREFDAFEGTGSYFEGLAAGYNYVLPSHVVLGVEGDLLFPSDISGSQAISSVSTGEASYSDTVLLSGTASGRLGYALDRWLLYGTAGIAFSRDQIDRTQINGTAGKAVAGDVDTELLTRWGVTIGAGVEVGLTPKLSAKLEYRFFDFPSSGVFFAPAAQHYDSDLMLNTLELGLNYKLGNVSDEQSQNDKQFDLSNWAIHGQTTYVEQYVPPFRSPYVGPQSLVPDQARETWSSTLYMGLRLWNGAELWVDPEIDQGFGLSETHGVAGFVSGEAYKQGADDPYARLPRYFIRQTIDLGGETEKVEADANQFGGSQTADRLVITIGKFGVADADVKGTFDSNQYAHEPRTDFLNWALVDTGTFDYAADAWGFTYGTLVEWYKGPWTLRGGLFDLSIVPNSTELDPRFSQFQWDSEIERRYKLWEQPGKLRITGFLSRGRMGSFEDAIQLSEVTGQPADIAAVRDYRSRGGISINLEQQLTPDLGVFARAGVADGNIEPFDFTDIDGTVAAGVSLSGKKWGRPDDTWGLAGVINGISNVHEAFLNDGGLGIVVGDGKLPHPGLEQIIETYYSLQLAKGYWISPDYQFVVNPAYNLDRGPVSVLGVRLHAQF